MNVEAEKVRSPRDEQPLISPEDRRAYEEFEQLVKGQLKQ